MMKLILAIILVTTRLWVGLTILSWGVHELRRPELHSISEIEIYLVLMLFDIWLSSNSGIDITINKNDD